MQKVTFTVDEQTIELLKRVSSRLKKPQSVVFREAIKDYADRANKLSAEEKARLLAALDRMKAQKPTRPQAEVASEIAEIRRARRTGGRRHPVE